MTDPIGLEERVLGVMMGLAIGDALGAPVEDMDEQAIALAFPVGIRDYVGHPSAGLRPGQGSDDTQMAFLVAESIVEQRSLNMVDIAARLVAWGKDNPALGPSTGAGIAALAKGTAWHEAGQTAVASSGCLPRCAPVACIVTEDRAVDDTIACCKPTHRHPLALAAAVAQNLVLARLIRGLDWDQAFSLLDGARSQLEGISSIRDALRGKLTAPGAVDVLVEALRCVAQARDAEEALVASVALGGDTDTRAAVAGALAGARWGISAFPRRWIDGCEARDQARALGQSLARFRLFEDQ